MTIIAAALLPLSVSIFVLMAMMGIDTILGRKLARFNAKKQGSDERVAVKSKITREGFVSKGLMYFMFIGLFLCIDFFIIDKFMFYYFATFPVHYIASIGLTIIFILTEFDSVDEHYYHLKGKRLKGIISSNINKIKKTIIDIFKFKNDIGV